MEKNVSLRKLNLNEEIKVLDVINQDDDLQNTFSDDRGIRSRLANSCYAALIEKDRKTIGFIMIVNNPKTDKNEVDMGILTGYRNQGYGTEALSQLKDIIIKNKLEVEIQTKRKNTAAITSIIYNGFTLVRQDQNYYYYELSPEDKMKIKR